jgi:hypothetical protein
MKAGFLVLVTLVFCGCITTPGSIRVNSHMLPVI